MRTRFDRLVYKRNACPMCGSRKQHPEDDLPGMIVCSGCCEMLWPDELVHRKTKATRTAYMVANHIPSD